MSWDIQLSCYLRAITFDAVRRWAHTNSSTIVLKEEGAITFDAVRRWAHNAHSRGRCWSLRAITFDAVRRWAQFYRRKENESAQECHYLWCRKALSTDQHWIEPYWDSISAITFDAVRRWAQSSTSWCGWFVHCAITFDVARRWTLDSRRSANYRNSPPTSAKSFASSNLIHKQFLYLEQNMHENLHF